MSLAILLPALLQSATPAPQDAPTIVVTGRRLDETAKVIADCVARNCLPDEEVSAALAHAEIQFVGGDYRGARKTLHDTIGRVDRHAKAYPLPVSKIWRAESRISAHLGERDSMQSAQFEAIDALKAGLPKGDDRVLLQRLQVADTFIKQGKIEMGVAGYRTVADQARAKGVPSIEGTALLRIALLDAALAGLRANALNPESRYGSTEANYRQAKKSVAALLTTTDPGLQPFRDAGRLLDARLDAQRGDMRGVEALAADYARARPTKAVLLYAPLMKDKGTFFDVERAGVLGQQDFEGQWIDVTFLIDADGRVKDVEVLRESPTLRNDWVSPVLETVAKRRYAPIALPADLHGMRRVERYTMTSFWGGTTGTRMRGRGSARLEMLDLTAEPEAGSNATS